MQRCYQPVTNVCLKDTKQLPWLQRSYFPKEPNNTILLQSPENPYNFQQHRDRKVRRRLAHLLPYSMKRTAI